MCSWRGEVGNCGGGGVVGGGRWVIVGVGV